MDVTKAFGGGSLIGAPIFLKNGKKFGTLCGMDNIPYDFNDKDIKLFKSLATLLTYVIDLDNSYQQILKLSAPIVPLLKGIAILPLIGAIDEERGNYISTMIIKEAHKLQLNHLIIDLSGITDVEKEFFYLLNLVDVLKLLGIKALFTGMRPDLARKAIKDNHRLDHVSFFGNLQQALSHVGIKLTV
ncbi:STAS domain-containing protein [Alkalihalophilus lindianensis]|uniref:STAS domain-containing protein n=2 Tax=Alkalihalophilus lindianensis TaxID=1630542 RepID=A0ABU3X5P2_9BACI|nr:STAS domain-containing protein [Alkalihalophilus lindianensis]MDV2682769.1 STAS domain-containing protein [Alkalihalophilus lindianensis]